MPPEPCFSCTGIKENESRDSNTISSILTESDPIYDSPGNVDQPRDEHPSISQEFTGAQIPNASQQEEVPINPTSLGARLPCNLDLAITAPSKSIRISLGCYGRTTLSWPEEVAGYETTDITINLPSEEAVVTITKESIDERHHIQFQVDEIWRE